MPNRLLIILFSSLLLFSRTLLCVYAEEDSQIRFLTNPKRESLFDTRRIIETLKIKPGMNILDIGAGTGLFTFRFAEALKGTGRVFATEVNPRKIEHIQKRMGESKYKNIFLVLVKPEGVDPFYKEHTFDIIFLSQVYQHLWQPEDYFRELKPALIKEKGRLYIIHFKNISDFSEFEFDDFKKVAQVLISEGEKFPVFQRLGKEIQDFIKSWKGEDIPPDLRKKMVQDFNQMLLDRWLLQDLLGYYISIEKATEYDWVKPLTEIVHPSEERLAKWLIVHLDVEGVFSRKKETLTQVNQRHLQALNRILLTGIFKSRELINIQGPPGSPIYYLEKSSIISTLKAAGYEFVREYDFLPHHYFLEFKRKL